MKLGSQMDYHGSRAYVPDRPSSAEGDWLRRLGGRLAAWTKQKLELALRPGTEQVAETMWLVRGKEKQFSLLGAEYDRKPRRAVASCAFPEAEIRTRRSMGYRTDAE
jgi:hypothetical protein